jgi:hypothetical protein
MFITVHAARFGNIAGGPYWNPTRGGPVLEARGRDLCRQDSGGREEHHLLPHPTSLSLPLSHTLSLSHTHTHTHTLLLSLSSKQAGFVCVSLSLSLSQDLCRENGSGRKEHRLQIQSGPETRLLVHFYQNQNNFLE